MAITGAHAIIYSTNAAADRALLRDVFKFKHVDAGGGWLIFALPPAEVAVHPSGENDVHELYLMTDDIEGRVMLRWRTGARDRRDVTVPGGGKLGVYAPRHARPPEGS